MTIAVIGGGASGLMAAITAAERGQRVLLLERQARVGRKLMATGNGRCNISNLHADVTHYHGADVSFIKPAMDAFGVTETIAYFESIGLITVAEDSGRLYPFSDQAGSVVDVLRLYADERGVETVTGCEVTDIAPKKGGFTIKTTLGEYRADRVIVACGGAAGGKLGGTRSGYELLRRLGHSCTDLAASLVQLKTDTTFIRALKGVRADAAVTLTAKGRVLAESVGEVQFTEYGLSGPAIFDISRAVSGAGGGVSVSLDLMRIMSEGDVADYLARRIADYSSLTCEDLMTGLLHNRLARTVVRFAGLALPTPIRTLKTGDIARIARAVKSFRAEVTGTLGFDGAQVTAGGIRTSEFRPETLESRLVPGLFACGEVLDIDGDCGGYNLQWAWASGRLAGKTGGA